MVSTFIAAVETGLLLMYLIALPVSSSVAGRTGGVIASAAFLALALLLPSAVLSFVGKPASGKTPLSEIRLGMTATAGLALGALAGIWLGFSFLEKGDSILVSDMLGVLCLLGTAFVGCLAGTLVGLRIRTRDPLPMA